MKALITALGICALLFASGSAYAQDDYTWDGSESSDWADDLNWTPGGMGTDYPGENVADDTALINDGTNERAITLSSSLANTVHWVKIDANAAAGDMSLTLDNANSDLDIYRNGGASTLGYLQLVGRLSAAGVATFNYGNGSFACDWINLDGDSATAGRVVLDIDVDLTVRDATDSVLATGHVDVDVAGSTTFGVKDIEIGDGTTFSDFEMITNSGTISATKLTVKGDASNNSYLRVSAGTFQTE